MLSAMNANSTPIPSSRPDQLDQTILSLLEKIEHQALASAPLIGRCSHPGGTKACPGTAPCPWCRYAPAGRPS